MKKLLVILGLTNLVNPASAVQINPNQIGPGIATSSITYTLPQTFQSSVTATAVGAGTDSIGTSSGIFVGGGGELRGTGHLSGFTIDVLVSSLAVNSVYPGAVSAGSYTNISGVGPSLSVNTLVGASSVTVRGANGSGSGNGQDVVINGGRSGTSGSPAGGSIRINAGNANGGASIGGGIFIATSPSAASSLSVISISGNVGVGVDTPLSSLHVLSRYVSSTYATTMQAYNSSVEGANFLWASTGPAVDVTILLSSGIAQDASDNTAAISASYSSGVPLLAFGRAGAADSLVNWPSLGRVGINMGRTQPATALEVSGTVTATSFVGSGSGVTGVTASNVAAAGVTAGSLPGTVIASSVAASVFNPLIMQGGTTIQANNGTISITTSPTSTVPSMLFSQDGTQPRVQIGTSTQLAVFSVYSRNSGSILRKDISGGASANVALTLDSGDTDNTGQAGDGTQVSFRTMSNAGTGTFGIVGAIEARQFAATASAQTGQMYFKTMLNGSLGTKMTLDATGQLRIGDSASPTASLDVANPGTASVYSIQTTSGIYSLAGYLRQTAVTSCATGVQIDANGNLSACVASDQKLKTSISDMVYDPALIDALRPKTFTWKVGMLSGTKAAGFIAQDIKATMPRASVPAGKDTLGYDDRAVMAAVVQELQMLRKRVAALEPKK